MVVGDGNKNTNANTNNNVNSNNNPKGGGGIGDNANIHPSGIPREQIDNIMSGISNTGDVKMNNHRKKLRQRFDIIKKLGQGTYGKVQLGINKETGQEVAIKTIKKCKIEAEADLVRIRREVQIMSSVQHPNIIHIYEVFENREKMVLVMEFAAGGELYDYLSERKVLSEEEARRIFRQVATAVYYCHKHKICHRDLKLENILLDEYGNAKIADFGLSNVFDDHRLLATFCGSPLYASPEIVEGTPYQGPEVDCWSLGVLLYTLVYGSMPFDGSNFKRLVKQISQGDYYEPKKPSRASSLIREMLTVCPQKRATIEQICSHWWVNENNPLSCLELAEDLANQTPVRLDVLLSLTPAAVTAEQLVVPSSGGHNVEAGKVSGTVTRSHSVGSLREITIPPNTEAERRILDMVAAGGEAALMPSPTRTITPSHSPIQTKRKLENTLSTDLQTVKKKEKPSKNASLAKQGSVNIINAIMETEDLGHRGLETMESESFSTEDMERVGDICERLMQSNHNLEMSSSTAAGQNVLEADAMTDTAITESVTRQKTVGKLDPVDEEITTSLEETKAPSTKVTNKYSNKHKTADLINAIEQITPNVNIPTTSESCHQISSKNVTNTLKKISAGKTRDDQNDPQLNKGTTERRKSRILETAEKFQQMNSSASSSAQVNVKPKKFVIPGVNVGSYKKEYERRASASGASFTQIPTEHQTTETGDSKSSTTQENSDLAAVTPSNEEQSFNANSSISLEEARRSMENSIALLRQAQSDSTEKYNTAAVVNQLCAKTENINMDDLNNIQENAATEHERKLQNARAIIGNAIQPVLRSRPQLPSSRVPSALLYASMPSTQYMGNSGGPYGQMRWQRQILQQQQFAKKPTNCLDHNTYVVNDGVSGGSDGYGYVNRVNDYVSLLNPLSTTINKMNKIPHRQQEQAKGRKTVRESARMYQPQLPYTFTGNKQNLLGYLTCQNDGGSYNQQLTDSIYTLIKNPNQVLPSTHAKQFETYHNLLPSTVSSLSAPIITSTTSSLFNTVQQDQQQHHYNHHHQQKQPPLHQQTDKRNLEQHRQSFITSTMRMPINSAATTAADTNVYFITNTNTSPKPFYNTSHASFSKSHDGKIDDKQDDSGDIKTSTASITLKSATLPRRRTGANVDAQLDIKPASIGPEQSTMRFTTEMQHPIADVRAAPMRNTGVSYSPPIRTIFSGRASSLEPKEHIIPIQRAPYTRTTSNLTARSGSLSRQSTNDSESETTNTSANVSQSTNVGSSQPIKKSPREFIIPIAVEGGGYIKPRDDDTTETTIPSHRSLASTTSTFNRVRPTSRISSLLNDDNSPFQKFRTSTRNRSSEDVDDEIPFTLHKLRSSRPMKKFSQETDSQSSGEDDDDDGFEILTAENLFSTLLQRVRALTNRLNVNHDITAGFPDSKRLLKNMRQAQNPFWNEEPFGRSQVCYTFSQTIEKKHVRLKNVKSNINTPWRHSVSRDIGSKMDSIFATDNKNLGTGVGGSTLPRGSENLLNDDLKESESLRTNYKQDEFLDLADLDLSRLKLSKKDIETLSNITPGLPKCFQEQLLAKLPPTQARKLSRTLSVQNSPQKTVVKIYKRSQSGGRGTLPTTAENSINNQFDVIKSDDKKNTDFKDSSNNISTLTTATNNNRTAGKSSHKNNGAVCQNNNENAELVTIISQKEAFIKNQEESNPIYTNSNSLCSSCTTNVSEKYKYYSPYLKKASKDLEEPLSQKSREIILNGTAVRLSSNDCTLQLPPQPSADTENSTLTRLARLSQRRSSKLFKSESGTETNDKPIDKVIDDANASIHKKAMPKKQQQEGNAITPDYKGSYSETGLVKNRNIDGCYATYNKTTGDITTPNERRRSFSRSRETSTIDNVELADKILQELQLLSKINSLQRPILSNCNQYGIDPISTTKSLQNTASSTTAPLMKKLKKVKVKEKKSNDTKDLERKVHTSTIKKVNKMNNSQLNNEIVTDKITNLCDWEEEVSNSKKESNLRRPKSYPSRSDISVNENSCYNSTINKIDKISPDKENTSNEMKSICNDPIHPESRLLRPKSYPSTKLSIGAKVSKQTISDDGSIIQESISNSNINENSKKIMKTAKKSKIQKPTTLPINTYVHKIQPKEENIQDINTKINTIATTTTTTRIKEKSPDKKTNKGLLYAIGQKFERLRDSAMHKERRPTSSKLANNDDKNKEKRFMSCKKTKTAHTNDKTEKLDNTSEGDSDSYKNKKTNMKEKHYSDIEDNGVDKVRRYDIVKRSRIDTLIRTLRERSIPRQSSITTKTNLNDNTTKYIKRAISAEELTDILQRKSSVSRVFGLFKRSSEKEKYNERHENKVRSTRSTGNIERSSSPIYENIQRNVSKSLIKLNQQNIDSKLTNTFNDSHVSRVCYHHHVETKSPDNCLVCLKNPLLQKNCNDNNILKDNKVKRQDLVIDLNKIKNIDANKCPDNNFKYTSSDCKIVNSNYCSKLLPSRNSSTNSSSLSTVDNNSLSYHNNNTNNNNYYYNSTIKKMNNNNNNNNIEEFCPTGYRVLSTHDVNHLNNNSSNNNFLISPSCENITYYSSDSKSCQDDCASNSTFVSPTEERELYFDNWSVCSDDNYCRGDMIIPAPRSTAVIHSKSTVQPITSSLNNRGGSGGDGSDINDPNESVIDRIKRRSFYSRFNEKKSKRISSIVGPNAVREYYREQQAVIKSLKSSTANRSYVKENNCQDRECKRNSSPDITQEFLRPLKLSPIGTELKPPIPKTTNNNISDKEYSTTASGSSGRSRKSLNDLRIPAMSTISKQFDSPLILDNVYFSTTSATLPTSSLCIKTSPYNSSYYTTSTGSYYSTYNPKRRSSYAMSGVTLSSTSEDVGGVGVGVGGGHNAPINGYATMGRKPLRIYDQRYKSLLDSSSTTSSNYKGNICSSKDYSAGTLRYRTPSATRSPTNI